MKFILFSLSFFWLLFQNCISMDEASEKQIKAEKSQALENHAAGYGYMFSQPPISFSLDYHPREKLHHDFTARQTGVVNMDENLQDKILKQMRQKTPTNMVIGAPYRF